MGSGQSEKVWIGMGKRGLFILVVRQVWASSDAQAPPQHRWTAKSLPCGQGGLYKVN